MEENARLRRPGITVLQAATLLASRRVTARGLKVFVVRDRRTYYATNRLTLTAKEVRNLYRIRHEVEEVIKVLKRQLSLEACQGGYPRSWKAKSPAKEGAQTHHIALWLVAYVIVERERLAPGCTWRQLKRRLILQGSQAVLPALERIRAAA